MTTKTTKKAIKDFTIGFIYLAIFFTFLTCVSVYEKKGQYYFGGNIAIYILILFSYLMVNLSLSKQITLSKDGVEVKRKLFGNKFYKWSDYKEIRIETIKYQHDYSKVRRYHHVLVLTDKPYKNRPKRRTIYEVYTYPLISKKVCIFLDPFEEDFNREPYFECEEKVLLSKLNEWGVQVDNKIDINIQ